MRSLPGWSLQQWGDHRPTATWSWSDSPSSGLSAIMGHCGTADLWVGAVGSLFWYCLAQAALCHSRYSRTEELNGFGAKLFGTEAIQPILRDLSLYDKRMQQVLNALTKRSNRRPRTMRSFSTPSIDAAPMLGATSRASKPMVTKATCYTQRLWENWENQISQSVWAFQMFHESAALTAHSLALGCWSRTILIPTRLWVMNAK